MCNIIDFELMCFGEVFFYMLDCLCCWEIFYYVYLLIILLNEKRFVNFYFNLFYYINRVIIKILNKCVLVRWINNKKNNYL